MPADTSVKYFHSEMAGAPSLSGTAGALISVLDACLVNGFGLKSVDALVIAANEATMTISTGHSFEVGSVALVEGVTTPAAINGQHRVAATTGTTVKFETTGIADQTATGTITTKLAPAGWSKAFSGTNLAAYKQIDLASSGMYMRIDDTAAQVARVVGYETMSDVNTGADPFPTALQLSGGGYIPKSSAASSATRRWLVVATSRAAYIMPAYHASYADAHANAFFGDVVSRKVGDTYSCTLVAEIANNANSGAVGIVVGNVAYGRVGAWIARDHVGLSKSLSSFIIPGAPIVNGSAIVASGDPSFPAYPSPVDGVLQVGRAFVQEGSTIAAYPRGEFPGFLWSFNFIGLTYFPTKTLVDAEGALAGRKLLSVTFGGASGHRFFIDVTGPWV